MRKKLLLSFCAIAFFLMSAVAQTVVSGKVADDSGAPLPGASIKVKGTKQGVSADANGTFKLTIPGADAILTIGAVGFVSQDVKSSANVMVQLAKDVTSLSEVIVTSLGIRKEKKQLVYAVSDVKAEQLQQKGEPDLLRALSGKVPGVDITSGGGAPGQSTRINLRGNTSFTASNQPLFVVDGVPFDNSVNNSVGFDQASTFSNRAYDIDPNNIESMTVLKGISASALYGQRAANGVILITTKSGAKTRKGLEVSYSTSYSQEKISSLPDYQNSYGQGSNQNYNGGFIGNWGAPFGPKAAAVNAASGGILNYAIVDKVPTQLKIRYPGLFPELPDQIDYKAYDILSSFFETGKLVENSLSVSAGDAKNSLNVTATRTSNTGIIPNSNTGRTSVSVGGNSQLANGLVVSGTLNYVNNTQQNPKSGASLFGDYGGGTGGSIFDRLYYFPRSFPLGDMPFEDPRNGNNIFYRPTDNPLWTAKYNLFNSNVNRIYGNINVAYDVAKWLNLAFRGGMNTYTEAQRQITRQGGNSGGGIGSIWNSNIRNSEKNFQFLATTKGLRITKDIDVTARAGAESNERSSHNDFQNGIGFIVPGLYKLTNTSNQSVGSDYDEQRRILGAFGSVDFSYNNYLFLNVTGRNDWSSTLPATDRSYFYPSAGVSFIFSDALKLQNNIFSYGKVRANFAQTKRDVPPYQLATTYNVTSPSYLTPAGATVYSASLSNSLKNANLRPEGLEELEFGADLNFFNGRVKLDLTYYIKTSSDLFVTKRIPVTSGFSSQAINAGSIRNNGYEAGVDITAIKTKSGFTWNTFFSFSKVVSKVLSTDDQNADIILGNGAFIGNVQRVGQPFGMLFGLGTAKDDKGNSLIWPGMGGNGGKHIYAEVDDIIGDPNANFKLGVTNSFSYKNFTLSALVDWWQGGQIYSITAASLLLRGQLSVSEDREGLYVIPGVYGDNDTKKPILDDKGNTIKNTTSITAFDYFFSDGFGAYGPDDTNIYDKTTVRLRELTFGYTIPKSVLKKTPFGSATISFSGRNLWFKAPNMLKGLNFDPEVLSDVASSNIQGIDLGAAPSTKRLGVNLRVTF